MAQGRDLTLLLTRGFYTVHCKLGVKGIKTTLKSALHVVCARQIFWALRWPLVHLLVCAL